MSVIPRPTSLGAPHAATSTALTTSEQAVLIGIRFPTQRDVRGYASTDHQRSVMAFIDLRLRFRVRLPICLSGETRNRELYCDIVRELRPRSPCGAQEPAAQDGLRVGAFRMSSVTSMSFALLDSDRGGSNITGNGPRKLQRFVRPPVAIRGRAPAVWRHCNMTSVNSSGRTQQSQTAVAGAPAPRESHIGRPMM